MLRQERVRRRAAPDATPARTLTVWRERAVGAVLATVAVLLGLGLFSHLISDENQFFGTISRIADSMRPWLLALAILLSGILVWLRAWRSALLCALIAIAGFGAAVIDYRARVAPWADETDLRVLWFNILITNPIAPEDLEIAVREADADVVVFGESPPAFEMKAALSDIYPYSIGCKTETRCEVMVLSRYAPEDIRRARFSHSNGRLLRFSLTTADGEPFDLVAVHLTKPWYLSVALEEMAKVSNLLNRDTSAPLMMLGDFNAAPWSRRVRTLEIDQDLRHPPRPIGTWPATLGRFGVPIDHMLVRGGARFAWQEPWGGNLGSNHRGLLAGIALPDAEGN